MPSAVSSKLALKEILHGVREDSTGLIPHA